jgi:23S rRNA (guanosine2251-2'-O)-methyltransferase
MEKKQNTLIYGVHPVLEALESGKTIDKVWIQEGHLQGPLAEILGILRQKRILWKQVPTVKLNTLVRGNHQGVVIALSSVDFTPLDIIISEAFSHGDDPFILVLDGITDVRNFGAIARTASCAGIHGILVPEQGSAPIGPDAVKTSAGALLKIPVARTNSMYHAIRQLKNSGLTIIGATEKAAEGLYQADLTGPVALVMGNEETGLSPDVLKLCDQLVKIPMSAGGVDSLNVSVSTGVVVYEIIRQRTK